MKKFSFAAIMVCLVLASCNNKPENPNNPEVPDTTKVETILSVYPTSISAPKNGHEYTLLVSADTKWSVNSDVAWLSYTPGVGKNNGTIKLTVAPSTTPNVTTGTITITEYGTGNTEHKATCVVTREGMDYDSKMCFSVSDTTKVIFAPGNLQYQASTGTWRFAEHQWDIIGDDNKNISDSYDGWIDLFGWGTGNNPTLTSTSISKYSTFTDWGVNPVSNGGNTANKWRTPKADEWRYLLNKRNNAKSLMSSATVNGIHGCIFLPDNYFSNTIRFTPNAPDWSTNDYSVEQWQELEDLGAVFLPNTGYRSGTGMFAITNLACYWSSKLAGNDLANVLIIQNGKTVATGGNPPCNGNPVRLVQVVK
ncbi:MAG: BACON domain-containing protein [Paludibacteraceae bacterium]|nr:BACON domain-containing protein [Paludibacteraceae bacterium]